MNDLIPPNLAVSNADERNLAMRISFNLRKLHSANLEEFNFATEPLKEKRAELKNEINRIKKEYRLDEIESAARLLNAKILAYDKAQEIARAALAAAQLEQATANLSAPIAERPRLAPIAVEPAKPIASQRRISIVSIDLALVPREYLIADEQAIKTAGAKGKTIPGVKFEWVDKAEWRAK